MKYTNNHTMKVKILLVVTLLLFAILPLINAENFYISHNNQKTSIPSISATGDSTYPFLANNSLYKVYFRQNSNTQSFVKFIKDGYTFQYDVSGSNMNWVGQGANTAATTTQRGGVSSNSIDSSISISGNKVTYEAAFGNTDIEYELLEDRIKENFVLTGLPSIKAYDYLRYTGHIYFNSSLKICANNQCYIPSGNQDEFTTSGRIEFKDSNNKVIYYLDNPIITDSAGNTVQGYYKVRGSNAQMVYELRIPKTFLASAVYPIYIDPTIVSQAESKVIYEKTDYNITAVLQKWNGTAYNIEPNDIFINDSNPSKLKFGAIDNSLAEGQLANYRYLFSSTAPSYEKEGWYYFYSNLSDVNKITHIDFRDICLKGFGEFTNAAGLKDYTSFADCSISRYSNSGLNYIQVDFTSDKNIDPSFAGGSGTSASPWQITNWTALNETRLNKTAYYILNNNLNSSTSDYSGIGNAWIPYDGFTGNFNGNGYKIANLVPTSSSPNSYRGLFGDIQGTVSNLDVISSFTSGTGFDGGIAGTLGPTGGYINNCKASTTSTSGSSQYLGGIIGFIYGTGNINNSQVYSTSLSAPGRVGACAGAIASLQGVVNNCSATIETSATLNSASSQVGLIAVNSGVTATNNFLTIRNATYGFIKFLELITGSTGNILTDVKVLNNSVSVNSAKSALNKSANITLYNLPTTMLNPTIYRDGNIVCNATTSPSCYNFTSLNAGNVTFNVSSWSNYTVLPAFDSIYPVFYGNWDDSGTFLSSGVGNFNISVNNTNGTVYLNINGTSILATNLTENTYNVSFTFTTPGNYSYNWTAYGNGFSNNLGSSSRYYYAMRGVLNGTLLNPANDSYLFSDQNFTVNITAESGINTAVLYINSVANYTYTAVGNVVQTVVGTVVSLTDGIYSWFYRLTDNIGFITDTDIYQLTLDVLSPLINIFYPIDGANYAVSPTAINFTVSDYNLSSCWFSNDLGATNTTINCTDGTTSCNVIGNNGTLCNQYSSFGCTANWLCAGTSAEDCSSHVGDYATCSSFSSCSASPAYCDGSAYCGDANSTSCGTYPGCYWDSDASFCYEQNQCWDLGDQGSCESYFPAGCTWQPSTCDQWYYNCNEAWDAGSCDTFGGTCSSSYSCDGTFDIFSSYTSFPPASNGQNIWRIYANDSGNHVSYAEVNFTVGSADSTAPNFTGNSPYNMEISWGNEIIQQINATDETEFDCFSINETTLFEINCSGYFKNITGINLALYYINVTINDTSNNQASAIFYINVTDTTNPNVTLISPANNTYTNTDQNFTANVSDETSLANATLNIYNQTGIVSQITTILTGSLESVVGTVVTLVDGIYTWFYEVFDSANNYAISENRTLTVDKTIPLVSISLPLNQNYTTNVSQLDFSAHDTNLANCWYSLNNGITNTSIACTSDINAYIYYLTSNEGTNTWTVYVNDSAGNKNQSSVTFFKDTIYPTIEWGNGVLADYSNVSQSNIYMNVTWTETNFGNITFWRDGVSLTNTSQIYEYNATGLADGLHTYYVKICDAFNQCNQTSVRTITLDTVNPNATLILPANGTYKNTNQNYTINVSDNLGVKNATVYINNTAQGTINFGSGIITGTYGLVVDIVDGVYSWFYKLFDWAGNSYTTSNGTVIIDKTIPVALITNLNPNPAEYAVDNVTLNWTASDTYLNNSYFYITNSTGDIILTANSTRNLILPSSTFVSPGLYRVRVFADDYAQNNFTTNPNIAVIDVRDEVSPTMAYVNPTTNGTIAVGTINVNITSTDHSSQNITIRLYKSNILINSSSNLFVADITFASSTFNYYLQYNNLDDGDYYVNATSCDVWSNCENLPTQTTIISIPVAGGAGGGFYVSSPATNVTAPVIPVVPKKPTDPTLAMLYSIVDDAASFISPENHKLGVVLFWMILLLIYPLYLTIKWISKNYSWRSF